MKRICLILLLILVATPIISVAASDISTATYSGVINITNASTATTEVAVPFTLSSADMISQGWVDSAFTRAAIQNTSGTDVPFMPGWSTNPWVIWEPSMSANTQENDALYVGPSSLNATKYYFSGTGGMTVADSATIELGNTFQVDLSGYIKTDMAGILIDKDNNGSGDGFDVRTDGDGNIKAIIGAAGASSVNATILPDGAGLSTLIPSVTGAATHWDAVNDPVDTFDDNATYVSSTSSTYTIDYFTLTAPAYSGTDQIITAVKVYYRATESGDAGHAIPYLYFNGADIVGGEQLIDSTWRTFSYAFTRPGGGAWQLSDFADLQAAVSIKSGVDGVNTIKLTQVYVELTYNYVTATTSISKATANGDHDLSIISNGVNLWITVDGAASANAAAAAVTNNAFAWTIAPNVVMPYMEDFDIEVSGVPAAHWAWEYGATFTDTVSSLVATPSFRTTSSDADVSASLISFQPIQSAQAPAYTVNDPPDFISSSNITVTSTFSSGNTTAGGPPGSGLIDEASTAGGTSSVWLWGWLAMFTVGVVGLGVSHLERSWGSGGGTLLIRIIGGILIFGPLIAFGKFDFWMLFFYLVIAVTPTIASRSRDLGGSIDTLNMVGFLAFAWVGMTLINNVMGAQLVTSSETAQLNKLMFTQEMNLIGIFHLPVMNFEFFTQGIPGLLKWDYSFFGGNAQIIQYLLYSLTAVMSMIIFGFLIGTVSSYFVRRT